MCQDLLEPDWGVQPAAPVRGPTVSGRDPEDTCPQQTGWSSASLCNGSSLHSSTLGLRQLSSTCPAPRNDSLPNVASLHCRGNAAEMAKPGGAQEEFDDWDIDLADLDECQIWQPIQSPVPPAPVAATPKTLRPPSHVRALSPGNKLPPQTVSTPLQSPYFHPIVHSAPLRSPNLCPAPSPISRPQQPHRPCTTPRPCPQPRGLFDAPSPVSSTILNPQPHHTPVLTNRLVQLVSASSKLPSKRPRSGGHQPRPRRFPGPAGLLPEQVSPPRAQVCLDIDGGLSLRCCSSNKRPAHRTSRGHSIIIRLFSLSRRVRTWRK